MPLATMIREDPYKNSIIEPDAHGKRNETVLCKRNVYVTEQANDFFVRQFHSGARVSSRC